VAAVVRGRPGGGRFRPKSNGVDHHLWIPASPTISESDIGRSPRNAGGFRRHSPAEHLAGRTPGRRPPEPAGATRC